MTRRDTQIPCARQTARLMSLGVVATALLLGAGATAAWASWVANARVPGITISAASLDLQFADSANAAAGTGTPYAKSLSLPVTDLVPRESAAFTLAPKNSGSTRITYTVSASNASMGVLGLRFFSGSPGNQSTTYPRTNTCSGTALGPQLTLSPNAAMALSNSRALAVGHSETLCVIVSVVPTAPATAANSTQAIVLDFTAAQVR